jgi:hypothetical protein
VDVAHDAGTTGGHSVTCHSCGGGPVLRRARGVGPGGSGICRNCVVSLTALPRGGGDESALSPTADSVDDEVVWERFDTAFASRNLLQGIKNVSESEREETNCGWSDGPADGSPAPMAEDVARILPLLTRHGFHEASVAMGIDLEVAARGQLGSFHQTPDPSQPRRTARVGIQRSASPPGPQP